MVLWFFFFNDTATTEIYTLSLHDALPVLAQHPQRLRRAATLVGEEREVEVVLLAEAPVRLGGVERDAVDLDVRLLVVPHPVPEGAGLLRAAGGVVLGVEVEDGLLSAEIPSRDPLPILGYELDVGEALALLRHSRHETPSANWC